MPRTRLPLLSILVHPLALLPLVLLAWDFWHGGLGANPIREIQLRTGIHTLLLLTLSLAVTPFHTMTGVRSTLGLRRTLGLYALLYASLHVINLVGLDYLFDFRLLWRDVAEKRYIMAGLPAFLSLLALSITSTDGWKNRLGRHWRRLHRLAYLAGVLAVVHYFWQVKIEVPGPVIYGSIIVLLLLARLPPVEKLAATRLPWRRDGSSPGDSFSVPGPLP